jgi:hypothetical protein
MQHFRTACFGRRERPFSGKSTKSVYFRAIAALYRTELPIALAPGMHGNSRGTLCI